MAAAEASPFAKVGGLADVVGSLPPALLRAGIDIRVVLPLYKTINRARFGLHKIYKNLEVPSGMVMIKINVWQGYFPETNVRAYFIEAPEYFNYNKVYVSGDNSERFLFFSLAALYMLGVLSWRPNIVHCQDNHVALIPDIIKTSNLGFLQGIKTLFTIHNFNYQGIADIDVLSTGNLHKNSLKSLTVDARDGDINFMVQGVLNADIINTVSKTYAKEITTSAFGAHLEKVIRKRRRDLYGIINGIDTNLFNPATDKHIIRKYNIKNINKKIENKTILQKIAGLPQDKNKAVIGMVSRLVWQKGIDLITERFSKLDCQFVFLGTGKLEYETHLKKLAKKYPDKFSVNIDFDLDFAQKIYAGADMFLMPSRFEPCGLGQMIAMRYGTIPIVRVTGGLKDTVDQKTGFSFKNVSKREFFNAINTALDIYYHQPKKWRRMMKNCLKRDFSWEKSAHEYLRLYKKILFK